MKKSLAPFLIIAALAMSFTLGGPGDNKVTITLTESQLSTHWNNLNAIKKMVDESNLPHAQVKGITAAIDSFQMDISRNLKIDSITKKR